MLFSGLCYDRQILPHWLGDQKERPGSVAVHPDLGEVRNAICVQFGAAYDAFCRHGIIRCFVLWSYV